MRFVIALFCVFFTAPAMADKLTIVKNGIENVYIGKIGYMSIDEENGGVAFTVEAGGRPHPARAYAIKGAAHAWEWVVDGKGAMGRCVAYVSIDHQSEAPSEIVLVCEGK